MSVARCDPRVEQALTVRGEDRHVDDDEILDELLAAVEEVALGVEGQRAAVEHQLVLAADLVDVHQRRVAVGGTGGEHPLPVGGLAGVVRRGVDVDGELGAAVSLDEERTIRAPDVLTDADADVDAADDVQLERVGHVAGHEVAGLVEHGVVGQQPLAVRAEHPCVGTHGGGVEQIEVLVDVAEHCDATPGVAGQAGQRRLVVGDEARFEHEILRRVAGDAQLREGGDVAAGLLGEVVGAQDLGDVAVEVTNRHVELGQGDTQHGHRG